MSNSNLGYIGNVKIELKRGDTVYKTVVHHNEGTAELFRYIANAIAGNTNSDNMPKYIHTFYSGEVDPEGRWKSSAKGNKLYGDSNSTCSLNVPFSNVEVRYDANLNNNEGGYSTEFTFMIPYSQIKGTTNVLALYNSTNFGTNRVPLAYIKLDKDTTQGINEWIELERNNTANIVVTWVMSVCNQIA